jgi:hypothetical protein
MVRDEVDNDSRYRNSPHIPIQEKLDGKVVEWLEKVSAEQQRKE